MIIAEIRAVWYYGLLSPQKVFMSHDKTLTCSCEPKHRQYRHRWPSESTDHPWINGQLKHIWLQHLQHHPPSFSAQGTRDQSGETGVLINTWRRWYTLSFYLIRLSLSRKVWLRSNRCLASCWTLKQKASSDSLDVFRLRVFFTSRVEK